MEDDNQTTTALVSQGSTHKFVLLLIVEICSILCSMTILSYLVRCWHVMVIKALRNHIILILMIISFINVTLDLPFTINTYRLGYDDPRTPTFCRWWYWIDYTLIITSLFLTASASVQRHVLIFNAHWLNSRRTRLLVHFMPILICLIYPPVFYLAVIVGHTCELTEEEATSESCSQPCYTSNNVLFNVDWIFNTACPLAVMIIANIILIIRVIHSMRKTRRKQALTWKRQRKLTLQLLVLSSLYIVGWLPSTVLSIIQSFVSPTIMDDLPQLDYLNFIAYFVCPSQPFVCLMGLPELIKSLKSRVKRLATKTSVVVPLRAHPSNRL